MVVPAWMVVCLPLMVVVVMKMNFKFQPIPPNVCMIVFVCMGFHILLSPNYAYISSVESGDLGGS